MVQWHSLYVGQIEFEPEKWTTYKEVCQIFLLQPTMYDLFLQATSERTLVRTNYPFPLKKAFARGTRYFDLNLNKHHSFQIDYLTFLLSTLIEK